MKKFILMSAVAALLFSCNGKKENFAIISGKIDNPQGKKLELYHSNELAKELKINADGTFNDTIRDYQGKGYYNLFLNEERNIPVFLEDGTNMNITIVNDNIEEANITGKGSEKVAYLKSRVKIAKESLGDLKTLYSMQPAEFLKKLNASVDALQDNAKKANLPADFAQLENKWIDYNKDKHLILYPLYFESINEKKPELPTDFPKVPKLDPNNEKDYNMFASFAQVLEMQIQEPYTGETPNSQILSGTIATLKDVKNQALIKSMATSLRYYAIGQEPALLNEFNNFANKVTDPEFKQNHADWFKKVQAIAMGQPAYPFVFDNYNGGTTSLKSLKGKLVYVDIWATWCGPCRQEIPFLQELEKEYHGKNIEFVGISIDKLEREQIWRNMIKEKNMTNTQLLAAKSGKDKEFMDYYLVEGVPTFLLIDENGMIISANAPRPSQKQEVRALINKYLK